MKPYSRNQVATAIAVLFHGIGLLGILFFNREFFISVTAFNLLLMLGLVIWTQKDKHWSFFVFLAAAIAIGMATEIAGTRTGVLFGSYSYGKALGPSWQTVPLIVGVNWFLVVYGCGMCIHTILQRMITRIATESGKPPLRLKAISVIVDGASLAVFFDWVMEPVAVKLGYWQWAGNGDIPAYNYISWLLVSMVILAIFHFSPFRKQNKFAIHLLLIQLLFFLLLRTFL